MTYALEVIAFTINAVLAAQKSGANRIELCDNPLEGGTTPSFGIIQTARAKTTLQLFPIIRPHGGDFLYSDEAFDVMKTDIKNCKLLGCDGVVTGILKADGTVDKDRTARLVELAYPLDVTFHRAFDRVANPFEALEDIIACGCTRILTSGLKPTAPEGADLLADLVKQSAGRICIMPGSGVRASNLQVIANHTGCTEFHSSARKTEPSAMTFNNTYMNESLVTTELDEEEVRLMVDILEGLSKQ